MSDELPKGWASARLEEIVTKKKGKKPAVLRDTPALGFVPYLDIHAIEKNVVRQFAEVKSSKLAAKDDLFVVWDGARSGWVGGGITGAIGSTIMALTAQQAESRYVRHFIASQFQTLNNNTRGTGIPHVDPEVFWNLEIPLAPLAEQRRIVAKLEMLLGKVDASQQRLAKIPVLLKRFRQSVLAAACSGRLTADWQEENPANETSEDLLSKVLKQRADMWKRSGRKGACPEAPMADTSSLPDVPHGWAWIPLGILGASPFETVQTGPFGALLHKEEFTASGVPVVAVGNLTGMGFTKEGLYFVSDAKAEQLARFDIQAGDVLFARSGATLGKVCVAPPDAKDWRMTGHILRARLNRHFLLPDFCVFALRGDPAVTRQVFGSVQGTTRPGYNTTLLESIALPLAPLPEQQEIVRRVEGLFALADQLELRLAKARGQVEKLTPSLLARAFAGQLVPQDPTDEPAEKLLERIRGVGKGKA